MYYHTLVFRCFSTISLISKFSFLFPGLKTKTRHYQKILIFFNSYSLNRYGGIFDENVNEFTESAGAGSS